MTRGTHSSLRRIAAKSNAAGTGIVVRTRKVVRYGPSCTRATLAGAPVEAWQASFTATPWYQPSPMSATSSRVSRRW